MDDEPNPIRNPAIVLLVAVALVISAVVLAQSVKKKKRTEEEARLYAAITNEVFKAKGTDVERVAPLRQFLTRRSGDWIAFQGWIELSSTGGPIRRELEVNLKANYLTSGVPEVVSVRIKDVLR